MLVKPIKTRVFKEGENLFLFITRRFKTIPEDAVIVVTSKIVALSERRTALITDANTKARFIRRESDYAVKTKHVWLTVKDGLLMASAGIDESNGNGKLILLPKDSFKTAQFLRRKLRQKYQRKNLAVLITDSRTMPLRAGVTGAALGYAGFCGIKDYRGTPDIFGRKFHFSRSNVADGLATAAVLCMGEGDERQPLALITEAPVSFRATVNRAEARIKIQDDMYQPLFSKLLKQQ